jgi:hypothetical protein
VALGAAYSICKRGARQRQQLVYTLPPPLTVRRVRRDLAHEALAIVSREQRREETEQAGCGATGGSDAAGPGDLGDLPDEVRCCPALQQPGAP